MKKHDQAMIRWRWLATRLGLLLKALLLAGSMLVDSSKAQTDLPPDPHIRLRTEADVAVRREVLQRHIWRGLNLIQQRPTAINRMGRFRWRGVDFGTDKEIWEIVQRMAHGVETSAYYVARPPPWRCLVVLVQGHHSELEPGSPTSLLAQLLLSGGCDLIVHAMPLLGGNSQPTVETQNFGRIKISSHNAFMFLESDTFSPMLYFFEPIAAALNGVLAERQYLFVGMAGLSGGGWTTTIYSALDVRIRLSFAVAGSWPIPLMVQRAESIGDWEQTSPLFYAHASYSDLYLMSGHGGRHLELVYIERDPCCFSGGPDDNYKKAVLQQARALNSSVNFVVVPGRRHEINAAAANRLLSLIAARTGLSFPQAARDTSNICQVGEALVRRQLAVPFAANGPVGWTAFLPDLVSHASNMTVPNRSRLVLCENDQPIGEGDMQHDSIRKEGNGLYSHWSEALIFSTSDNSNPNTNGRSYSVVIPNP